MYMMEKESEPMYFWRDVICIARGAAILSPSVRIHRLHFIKNSAPDVGSARIFAHSTV